MRFLASEVMHVEPQYFYVYAISLTAIDLARLQIVGSTASS